MRGWQYEASDGVGRRHTTRRINLDEEDHEPDARPVAHYGHRQLCFRAGTREKGREEEEEEEEGRRREKDRAQRQHPLRVSWSLRNWPRPSHRRVVWRGLIFCA